MKKLAALNIAMLLIVIVFPLNSGADVLDDCGDLSLLFSYENIEVVQNEELLEEITVGLALPDQTSGFFFSLLNTNLDGELVYQTPLENKKVVLTLYLKKPLQFHQISFYSGQSSAELAQSEAITQESVELVNGPQDSTHAWNKVTYICRDFDPSHMFVRIAIPSSSMVLVGNVSITDEDDVPDDSDDTFYMEAQPTPPTEIFIPLGEWENAYQFAFNIEVKDKDGNVPSSGQLHFDVPQDVGITFLNNILTVDHNAIPQNISIKAWLVEDPSVFQEYTIELKPTIVDQITPILGVEQISVPVDRNSVNNYTFDCSVLDQSQKPLPKHVVSWSIEPSMAGVSVENGVVTVLWNAPLNQEFQLVASAYGLESSKTIKINQNTSADISLSSGELLRLDTFSVVVSYNHEFSSLYAFEAALEYDRTKLDFVEARSLISGQAIQPVQKGNIIYFAFVKGTEAPESFSGDLMQFDFKVMSEASSLVRLHSVTLLDWELLAAEHKEINVEKLVTIKKGDVFKNPPLIVNPGVGGGGGGGGGGAVGGSYSGSTATQSPTTPELNASKNTAKPEDSDNPSDGPKQAQNDSQAYFNDLEQVLWASNAISYLFEREIINGMGDQMFYPLEPVSRAQFVKMLVLGFELSAVESESPFSDVPKGAWFEQHIAIAHSLGILKGAQESLQDEIMAMPHREISREEMFVMIDRAILIKGVVVPDNQRPMYQDHHEVSEWAVSSVERLFMASLINGYEDGNILPRSNATRAETAQLIYNVITRIQEDNNE